MPEGLVEYGPVAGMVDAFGSLEALMLVRSFLLSHAPPESAGDVPSAYAPKVNVVPEARLTPMIRMGIPTGAPYPSANCALATVAPEATVAVLSCVELRLGKVTPVSVAPLRPVYWNDWVVGETPATTRVPVPTVVGKPVTLPRVSVPPSDARVPAVPVNVVLATPVAKVSV